MKQNMQMVSTNRIYIYEHMKGKKHYIYTYIYDHHFHYTTYMSLPLAVISLTTATSRFSLCKAWHQMDEKSGIMYPLQANSFIDCLTSFLSTILFDLAPFPWRQFLRNLQAHPIFQQRWKVIAQRNPSSPCAMVVSCLISITLRNQSVSWSHLISLINYSKLQKCVRLK